MHNGLNELDSMGLYYQLASHLVRSDSPTICVVRPFPGHLSRKHTPETQLALYASASVPLAKYDIEAGRALEPTAR